MSWHESTSLTVSNELNVYSSSMKIIPDNQ